MIVNILLSIRQQTTFNAGDIITTLPIKGEAHSILVGEVNDSSAWISIANNNVIFKSDITLEGGTYACQLISPVFD